MAPEQAKGKNVDRRADIWAFGVVMCELLTGKQLFAGDSVSEILAQVILKEPDLGGVPAEVRPCWRDACEKTHGSDGSGSATCNWRSRNALRRLPPRRLR